MTAERGGMLRDGALAGAASLVMNAATFGYYVTVTRVYGPAEGGLLLAIFSAILLLSMPAYVAGIALSSSLASMVAGGDPIRAGGVARRVLAIAAICSGAFVLMCLALSSPIDGFFHVSGPYVSLLVGLGVVAQSFVLLGRGIQQGLGELRDFARSNGAEAVTKCAAVAVILGSPAGHRLGLPAFTIALAVAGLVTVGSIVVRTRRSSPSVSSRGAFQEASGVMAVWIAIALLTYFDSILARHVLTPDQSGYYNAASLAGRALMTVLTFVPTLLLPKVSARRARGESTRGLGRSALLVTGGISLFAIGLFAIAPSFVIRTLAGIKFESAAFLVPWYGLAAACLSMTGVIAAHRLGNRERGFARWIVGAAAVEVLVLTFSHASAQVMIVEVLGGHALSFAAALAPKARNRLVGGKSLLGG